jgi:nucleoside recognition membrane protein YjiH
MEFLGILASSIVKPLFKLTGYAAVNLISAWVGPGNAGVVASKQLYDDGYFSAREASIIGTTFAISSIGWCVLVATILNIMNVFGWFYLTICIAGIVIAVISVRIPPLSKIPDLYALGESKAKELIPEGKTRLRFALEMACERASKSGIETFLSKIKSALSYIITLQPLIVTWGTIALGISLFTPIFKWISYPFGWYLKLLGVEKAFEIAPAVVGGFADNYLPLILINGVSSVDIKFIIGALSIVQLIFMSEIGALLLSAKLPIKFKDIVIIFLQRTIIGLPIIILMAKLVL